MYFELIFSISLIQSLIMLIFWAKAVWLVVMDNFIVFKIDKVSKILWVGIFQIPIDIVDVKVGLFHDNFPVALIHQNDDLLM